MLWTLLLLFQGYVFSLIYEGTLLDSNGTPIAESNVLVTVEIFDDGTSCIMYERSYTLDLSSSAGHFSLDLNTGTAPSSGGHQANTLNDVLSNADGNSVTCADTSTVNFNGNFVKRQLRLTVKEIDSVDVADIVMPRQDLMNLPFSSQATSVLALSADQVKTSAIEDGAVTNDKIASGIDSAKLTGALPAIDGSSLTGISASALSANSVGATELQDTAVTAGNYGSATEVATFTVDAQGRLTNVANVAITDNDTTYSLATGGADGLLSSLDFTKLAGIEANAKDDQTAVEIMTALQTVDTNSSGLNSDTLDGQQGSYYSDYNNLSNTPTIPDGHSLNASDGTPVDAVSVDGDGNVGIGTNMPGSPLHILDSADRSGLVIENNSRPPTVELRNSETSAVGRSANMSFSFLNSTSSQFSGSSISTVVEGNAAGSEDTSIIFTTLGNGTGYDSFKVTPNGAEISGPLGSKSLRIQSSDPSSSELELLSVSGQGRADLRVDSSDIMTLNSAGNVGIGTTSPGFPLEVSGVIHSSTGGFRLPDGTVLDAAADLGSEGTVTSITLGNGIPGSAITGSGTVAVAGGDGIVANADDIAVDLDTNPGLEFNSGQLRAKIGAGMIRDASGLSVDAGVGAGQILEASDVQQCSAAQKLQWTVASGWSCVADIDNDTTYANATTSVAGLMSDTDKTKIDNIADGAEVNVNADWNAGSGDAQILNKPIIPDGFSLNASDGSPVDALYVDADGNIGAGTTSPNRKLHAFDSFTDTSGTHRTARTELDIDVTSAGTGVFQAHYNDINSSGSTHAFNEMTAAYNFASHQGTGAAQSVYGSVNSIRNYQTATDVIATHSHSRTMSGGSTNTAMGSESIAINDGGAVTNLYGTWSQARLNTDATASKAYGVYADVNNTSASGTITDAYGLYATVLKGTGANTNSYGIYIGDVRGTTTYGIYQEESDDLNYFGGNVGIGVASPTEALEVNGNVKGDMFVSSSDANLKKNIETLGDALEKIRKLRGVTYLWRSDEYPERHFTPDRQYGVIAQEIEEVFPELVLGEEGNKSVHYTGLISPLIEATKEVAEMCEMAQEQTTEQERRISSLEAKIEARDRQVEKLEKENEQLKKKVDWILLQLEK